MSHSWQIISRGYIRSDGGSYSKTIEMEQNEFPIAGSDFIGSKPVGTGKIVPLGLDEQNINACIGPDMLGRMCSVSLRFLRSFLRRLPPFDVNLIPTNDLA
jgi:hypothetical protein